MINLIVFVNSILVDFSFEEQYLLYFCEKQHKNMSTRTKITPFARFFIFLIIFLPIAYFGAAYYNGEDPVAKIQGMMNGDNPSSQQKKQPQKSQATDSTYDLKDEISNLKRENSKLKTEVKRLKRELDEANKAPKKWGDG